MITDLLEVENFLKRSSDRTTLSQIILPFCSDTSGERLPVALISGNINVKNNLRRDGKLVPFEEELLRLESEIRRLKSKGQVIDLSLEMKNLQIEKDESVQDDKEIEIKEEFTKEDELLLQKNRSERKLKITTENCFLKKNTSSLDDDIEELLRMAELEELKTMNLCEGKSKIEEIKNEIYSQNAKKSSLNTLKDLKLPKINSSNPLIGDVIEREVLETKCPEDTIKELKKSSRFSLRR